MNPRLVAAAAVVVVVVEVFEVVEVVEAVSATFGALCSMLLIFGDAVVVVAPIPSSGVLELLLVVWHLFAFQSMFEKTNPKRHQWTEQPWSARELTLRGPFCFVLFVRSTLLVFSFARGQKCRSVSSVLDRGVAVDLEN